VFVKIAEGALLQFFDERFFGLTEWVGRRARGARERGQKNDPGQQQTETNE
jgi:hypothetical protein